MSCEDTEMSCLRGRTFPLKSHSAAAVLMVMMRAYKSMVGFKPMAYKQNQFYLLQSSKIPRNACSRL